MTITDKQFGMMELFYGRKEKDRPDTPQQLELFWKFKNPNLLSPDFLFLINTLTTWLDGY